MNNSIQITAIIVSAMLGTFLLIDHGGDGSAPATEHSGGGSYAPTGHGGEGFVTPSSIIEIFEGKDCLAHQGGGNVIDAPKA